MGEPLDEQYFKWLYSKVASVRTTNPTRTYWSLFRLLFRKEFDWTVPNDDNRVEDGRDLRKEFSDAKNLHPSVEWMKMECSMLEMLIALARRLEYDTEASLSDWFFCLLSNINLNGYNDSYFKLSDETTINRSLDRVVQRTYEPDGHGGLFPLDYPQEDQRYVELWYQRAAYLLEHE